MGYVAINANRATENVVAFIWGMDFPRRTPRFSLKLGNCLDVQTQLYKSCLQIQNFAQIRKNKIKDWEPWEAVLYD